MSWLNPDTLEVLPHSIRYKPASIQEWDDAVAWCIENIGMYRIDWACTAADMQMPRLWHFLKEEEATMFILRWS